MGEKALELKDSDLDKIGEYVKSRINEWIDPDIFRHRAGLGRELDLMERMIRVEEELKSQRELIKLGFEQMDRRFESLQKQMDARFEAVDERFKAMDSRFETMQKYMDARFEQVDKRFEQVERRFEQIDKKFNTITGLLVLGFTVLSLLIAFIK